MQASQEENKFIKVTRQELGESRIYENISLKIKEKGHKKFDFFLRKPLFWQKKKKSHFIGQGLSLFENMEQE